MFNYLKFKKKLNILWQQKRKTENAYKKNIKAAYTKNVEPIKIESIRSCSYHETKMINEEISMLVTDYWLEISNRYFLHLPSRYEKDMWEQCHIMSKRWVLTNKGITSVRAELNTYREGKYLIILKIMAAATGIVGATTGLFAIILSK